MTPAISPVVRASLAGLFDLPGVHGSFVLDGTGVVTARALPEVVDDTTLAEVGSRVVRLNETLQAVGLDPDLSVLRFAEHKVYVKALPGGILCIVTAGDVNTPALRMAANLVARKVGPEMVRGAAAGPPAPATPFGGGATVRSSSPGFAAVTPAPPAAPTPQASPPAANSGTRIYRGRTLG